MGIKSAFFICLIACIVFTSCFILIRCKGANVYSVITKAIASFCFIVTYFASLAYAIEINAAFIAIGLGLVCGLIGDILLDLKLAYKEDEDMYLNSGFVSFGIGHFFYIFALIFMGANAWHIADMALPISISLIIAAVMTVGSMYMMKKVMKFDFGKHTIITAIYSFILFFVTVLAISFAFVNTAFISIAIGLILFNVSDLILSMQYFGGQANNNVLQVLNHTCYYLAQIVIACTIFISILI